MVLLASPQPLYLHPPALTEEKEADIRAGKFVRDVVFRTVPKATCSA